MEALGEAGFEAARLALHAYLTLASARLDRGGRARILLALDRTEGGALEGALPSAVRRTFVRAQPPLDADVVGRFMEGVLARLAMEEHVPTLLRQLGHGAHLDGRSSLGWPELVMAGALLEEAGAPAADAVILDRLGPLAHRHAALAQALTRLEADLRGKSERAVDEAGRPLFVGEDGAPTHVGFLETPLLRDAMAEPLFGAPPEMQRDPFVESYTQGELWTRHFRRLPEGERKLEAWLRGNAKTTRIPRRPLEITLPPDPARLAILLDDAELLFAEIDGLLASMRALAELDEGPSLFCAPSDVASLKHELGAARDRLAQARALLAELLARGERAAPAATYEGRFDDALPESCLDVGAEPFETLMCRLAIARAVHAWLADPRAALAIPRVDTRLVEAFAARLRERAPPRADLAPFLLTLFRAESMLSRGVRAFSDLAASERGAATPEAAHASEQLALDLAQSQLSRGLDEAYFTAARAAHQRPIAEVMRALDALLGTTSIGLLPQVEAPVLERARICLRSLWRGDALLTPALRAAIARWPLILVDARAAGDADLWPLAFPMLIESVRKKQTWGAMGAEDASLLLRLAHPIPKLPVSSPTLAYGFPLNRLAVVFGGSVELGHFQRLYANDDPRGPSEVFFLEVEGDAVKVHPLRVLKVP